MLDDRPTGVGVYTANVVNYLNGLFVGKKDMRLTVFTPTRSFLGSDILTVKLPGILKSSKYGKYAALTRFLWNLMIYPLRARKFDLLLSTTTHGSLWLNNQIITIHDLISLHFNNISAHQRFYFKYILPVMIRRARKVIAISESTKRDIVRFLDCPEEKIAVVYNGYDEARFFEDVQAAARVKEIFGIENYFLAVGPTYPHKNFERLIEAYSKFDKEFRYSMPLVFCGGMRAYLSVLQRKVREAGISENVFFLGYVGAEHMPDLYRGARALLFPSLHEGFGFPLLEAMACGCPVLASNLSSMPEVCGEAALYFDPFSVEDMEEKIRLFASQPEVSSGLKAKGLERVKMFSWERTAMQLQQIIKGSLD